MGREGSASDIGAIVRDMVARSGLSMREVSRRIGRSDNYLSSMLRNDTVPSVDLFASIAHACGYSVVVEGGGVEYRIGPRPIPPGLEGLSRDAVDITVKLGGTHYVTDDRGLKVVYDDAGHALAGFA